MILLRYKSKIQLTQSLCQFKFLLKNTINTKQMSKHFKIIPFLIVIQTLISIISWSGIDILSTFFIWTCSYILIFSILLKKKKYFHPNNKKDYYVITIYFIWAILGIIRGIFTAENYWEWKQLSSGVLSLSLPLFVYIFIKPLFFFI